MSRWRNTATDVVVSVADEKDDRFDGGPWESVKESRPATKKATTTKK
jgi:hypothetical protein